MRELIDQKFWQEQPKLSALQKLVSIVRWYPTKQLGLRAWKLTARKLGFAPSKEDRLDPVSPSKAVGDAVLAILNSRLPQWTLQWSDEKVDEFSSGQLTLLNSQRDLGAGFDWNQITEKNSSHLWRFHLQYHEFFLRSLAFGMEDSATTQVESPDRLIFERMESWIANYSSEPIDWHDDAWHPYCLSRRIPVWSQLLVALDLDESEKQLITLQIQRFGKCLRRNIEWDLGGNHLLENIRAIAYTGALFFDSDWGSELLQFVIRQLNQQTEIQILPTGEHFERSPMYHCQVLWIYLEVSVLCQAVHPSLSDYCYGVACRMYEFLNRISHPDGEIPLFSDSVFQECPDVESIHRLIEIAGKSKRIATDSSAASHKATNDPVGIDYFVFGGNGNQTIVDCGKVAADGLPAHGHCDHGNFEMTLDGERVITDSGIVDYSGSLEQQFCKSSVAHNVTTLGGRNTCEIWGKFRMGFRGTISNCRSGVIPNQPNSTFVSFHHDAYRKIHCYRSHRLVGQFDSDHIFCFDYCDFEEKNDSNTSRISLLHFHPRIQLEKTEKLIYRFSTSKSDWSISFFDVDSIELMPGIYCPEFGRATPRTSMVFKQENRSRPFGWLLSRSESGNWSVESNSISTTISNASSRFEHQWKEELCI